MQNRKPFNLERALAGDPVVTRAGDTVTEIFYLKTVEDDEKIIAVINGDCQFLHENGRFWSDGTDNGHDLFMAPKTTTYWANVYKFDDDQIVLSNRVFKSEEVAKKSSMGGYLKTISFDIDDEPKPEKKTLWIGIRKECDDEGDHDTSFANESRCEMLKSMIMEDEDINDYWIIQIEVEV